MSALIVRSKSLHLLSTSERVDSCSSLEEENTVRSSAKPFTLWAKEKVGWDAAVLFCICGVSEGGRNHFPLPLVAIH